MSTVTTTIVPCPSLQAALNQYIQTCHMNPTPIKLVPYLLSAENSTGIRQLVNPRQGKKRDVQLIYDQQIPVSEVSNVSSCDLQCSASTERGNLSETYTIDCTDGVYAEEKITLTDWMESCRDNNELIMSRLASLMNVVARAVNQKTAQELADLVGDWDTSVATIGTLDEDGYLNLATETSAGNVDGTTFQKIATAKELTEFCAPTVMFGGLDWYQYMRLIQSGCCTDFGLDIGDLFDRFGQAVVFDKDMNNEFGADVGIILQNRSVQLLTLNYALNADFNPLSDVQWAAASNYYSTTLIHPESGIPMDVVFNSTCGAVHIIVTATTKAVGLPVDLYASGESMEGVTWVTGVQAVNP